MEKNFDLFISQLSETNATLDYFTDFEKVIRNTNKIAIKLNQLNYLIGKEDLRKAIKELYEENPKVFEVLDILLAVRTKDKKKLSMQTVSSFCLKVILHRCKVLLIILNRQD